MESTIAPSSGAAPIVSVSDMISNVAAKTTIPAPVPQAPAPTVQIVRDAPKLPLSEAPAGEAPVVPVAADGAEAPAEPTGEIAFSDDDADVVLSAQRNADGTYKTKLDPSEKLDFTIKDKATGEAKNYSKTLPELVRLAKDGVTLQTKMQEVQPEVDYYRTNAPQWKQQYTDLQSRLEAQEALNRELLTADDELVIQRREQYRAEMAPEKQLERLKAERTAEVEQRTSAEKKERHARIANSFMESRIAPALAAARAIVGDMAVTGAVTHYTNDLTVNGVIPPANWPEMERRINAPNGPFQTWLATERSKRTTESDTVKAAREAAEAAAKRAQLVVNDAGRQMAPIGRAGPDNAGTNAPLPKTATPRDVLNRINNRPLPAA